MGLFDFFFGDVEEKPDNIPNVPYKEQKIGVVLEEINVRTGPGIGYKRIRSMKPKTRVVIHGTCEDWYWLGKNEYCTSDSEYIEIEEEKKQIKKASSSSDEEFPYILTKTVFTDKEAVFYHALTPIVAKLGLITFTKMRVSDLIYVPKSHPDNMKWFNHIRSKHVDFVLCNTNLEPVLIIEVDDNSHNLKKNKESDDFKDKVFAQLGLPLLRVRRWQGDELEKQIKEALNIEKAGV